MLTRARGESEDLVEMLARLGAEVLHLPAIEIAPPADGAPVQATLAQVSRYAWVVFTSRNAVRALFDGLSALDVRLPPTISIAAVGEATARELNHRGVDVACLPSAATASSLAESLIARGIDGARVLLPLGDRARRDVPDALRAAGASVDEIVVYRTVTPAHSDPAALDAVERGIADVVVFASPSAVANLPGMLPSGVDALRRVTAVCIGPTTGGAARDAGISRVLIADRPASDALLEVILDACRAQTW